MKVTAAIVAATLALVSVAHAAELIDKSEPQKTPEGANVVPPIDVATVVGIAIGVGVIAAVASGGGSNSSNAITGTTGTTGTN